MLADFSRKKSFILSRSGKLITKVQAKSAAQIFKRVIFTARRCASSVFSHGPVSVCVCLSQVRVLSKQLNESSCRVLEWELPFLPILMKCDRMFILKLRERTSLRNFFPDSGLWLKLRSFDLLWICCTTCPYRVMRQLTRFRLIYRVARSVCSSRASCSLMSQTVASFLTRMLHQVWCRYGAIFGRLFTGCSVFCWPTAPSCRLVIIPLS